LEERGEKRGEIIGEKRGEKRGEEKGIDKHLIGLICIKLARGMDIPAIAREVEEPDEKVSKICKIASEYAPDYDVEAILKKLRKAKA
ncbi:MAG: hypothetical protein IK139_01495, partial [Lachnospiraceae bacterium]|nr:hypothetical protein [Lachnospiraceae bacterium]